MNITKIKFVISFILLVKETILTDRIWIIRHCDKPKNNNPCCSDIGYKRSVKWGDYFKQYLHTKNKIYIVTSDYKYDKVCINNYPYSNKINKKCQKSQRMFLTSYYLSGSLKSYQYSVENINTDYCIGEPEKVFSCINTIKNKYKEIILIWEHTEIIEIIQKFNIDIDKWHKKYKNNYDIVFMIDIENKKLSYGCFDFETNNKDCSQNIDEWLGKFDKIKNDKLLYLSTNKNNDYLFKSLYNIFVTIIIIIIFLFCFNYLIKKIHLFKNYMRGYVEIH
jgi:hypothetical protein